MYPALRSLGMYVGLAVLCACSHVPVYRSRDATHEVLLARRGWHIDVGFAASDLGGPLAFLRALYPEAGYVFIGFGDERYVRSAQHRVPALLAAAWPGRGVMLVTALDDSPEAAFGATQVRRLRLEKASWDALQAFVAGAFDRQPGQAPLKSGPYTGSAYFASTRRYSGLHTCNTWVAEGLHAAGLPVRSAGVVLAGQLWTQLRPLEGAGAD